VSEGGREESLVGFVALHPSLLLLGNGLTGSYVIGVLLNEHTLYSKRTKEREKVERGV
jgi:hypothetical protein